MTIIVHGILLVFVSGVLITCFALEECVKVDDCTCAMADGKQIYIGSLGLQGSEAPRFGYELATQPQFWPWEYAYNPCYAFSDGTSMCKDAAACQRSSKNHSNVYNIGDYVGSTWRIENLWKGDSYVIEYAHTAQGFRRVTQVTLNCNLTAEEPILDRRGDQETSTTYYFTLTSKCACPGACFKPLPSLPPLPITHGLSAGSIVCIIFAVVVGVYFVGGALYMKVVCKANGVQTIPNYEMWSALPRNIVNGFVFSFNCCKIQGYDAVEGAANI